MKRIVAFIVAIILFIGIVIGYNLYLDKQIETNKNKLYYLLGDEKFNSIESAKLCLNSKNSDNILLLGSSELSSFNKEIFNNGNSDFNMYLIGQGYTQSLQNALALGAIEGETQINKVALVVSPQWFQSNSILKSEIFASKFQKGTFHSFLENDNISKETKTKVINRLKELEKTDTLELEKINRYEKAYLKNNIIEKISLKISNNLEDTKYKRKLINKLNDITINSDYQKVSFSNHNFDNLLEDATKKAEKLCTNNELKIYNDYYNKYVKDKLKEKKNNSKNVDFSNIQEYEDLELFLIICQELNIKPLIINVPVNGRWYDYIGISKEKREKYYNKVNDLAIKYNAKIADFSECEYEDYFLKDIMHLGLRGWLKVDEAVYKYYKEQ